MRFLILLLLFCAPLAGAIVQTNGKWSDAKYTPTLSVSEHYDLAARYYEEKKWKEALRNFLIITIHFPTSHFYSDSLFYAGVCFYEEEDYDLANQNLNKYLEVGAQLSHFEKVFEYKYQIAQKFGGGAKKHLFGVEKLPRLAPAKKMALEIYDEIISALSSHDLGLSALFAKAELQFSMRDYKESVETLSTLVRRFPKHQFAAESYLLISAVYLQQCILEPQNPDFISLAKVNLQKFRKVFPSDERVTRVEVNLGKMHETHATSLFEMGKFYEKKKKPKAARLYFEEAYNRYPETQAGKNSHERLNAPSA